MKAEKFNHPLLNMMNSPSSAADVWTRKQPETDTENKESVGDVNLPPVHTYDELKKIRRDAYIKMVAIIGVVVTALVFGSVAWFTQNREVEGAGVQMTASDLPFEVAVSSPYENSPDYSSLLRTQFFYDTSVHETGGSVGEIKCLMVDNTADSSNPMRGLQPGSYGTLTFQIKPKSVGTYELHFDVDVTGYHAEFQTGDDGVLNPSQLLTKTVDDAEIPIFYSLTDYAEMQGDKITELEAKDSSALTSSEKETLAIAREDVTDCPKAASFLNGHILFFENWNSSSKYYSDFIEPETGFDRTYTFTASDVAGTMSTERQEQLAVTIYWIWPNTFSQMMLDNGHKNLGEQDLAMFSSSQTADAETGKTPREELIDYICANNSYFFESTNSIFSDTTDENTGEVITASSKIQAQIQALSQNPDNIIALGNGYNNADQIIGENVQILFAEIKVSTE